MWVFGYGSLVWKPAFAHTRAEPAKLRGWTRRFWQGSTDHRGVPGAPGRVATLVPEEGSTCWGMAYQVAPEEHSAVLSRLDHREKGGYERHEVSLELPYAEETVNALVYLAGPTNPHYLGPAPLETIAAQVRRSRGPSGPNVEYVVRLAEALEQMRADDPHVFALAAFVSEPWAT